MTKEQEQVCLEVNDCSLCPYGKAITDFEGNFKGYGCKLDQKEDR